MGTTTTEETNIMTYKELLHAIVPHIRELAYEYDRVSGDGKDALDAIDALLNGEAKS
jgi:hypothetical protein